MWRAVSAAKARARGDRRRGEQGFALATTLAIMGAFVIIISALLGLTLSTGALERSGARESSRERAADAAIQTAIATMRNDPYGWTGRAYRACDPARGGLTVESVRVEVTCSPREVATLVPSTTETGTEPTMTLLGGWFFDSALWDGAPALRAAIDENVGIGFLHQGAPGTRLNIQGDVRTRMFAATLGGGSVAVNGRFIDADPFLCQNNTSLMALIPGLRAITPTDTAGSACPAPSSWVATPGWSTPTVPTNDINLTPAMCTATPGVVRLSPGRYGPAAAEVLRRWFKRDDADGCDNTTFWFQPGDYLFDAGGADSYRSPDHPNNVVSARGAIVLDDETSNLVFGTNTTTWDPSANPPTRPPTFPGACNRDAPGATITLGPTTTVMIIRGKGEICGPPMTDPAATPRATIAQAGGANQTWTGSADPSGVTKVAGDGTWRRMDTPTEGSRVGYLEVQGSCYEEWTIFGPITYCADRNSTVSIPIRGRNGAAAPAGMLAEARIEMRMVASTMLENSAPFNNVRYSLRLADGSTCGGQDSLGYPPSFTDVYGTIRPPGTLVSFNLLDIVGSSCPGALTEARQLDGAALVLQLASRPRQTAPGTALPAIGIDSVDVITTSTQRPMAPFRVVRSPQADLYIQGRTYLPQTAIEVAWRRPASPSGVTDAPVFGAPIVARAFMSDAGTDSAVAPGSVAAPGAAPGWRDVDLTATVDGRAAVRTRVRIDDTNPVTGRHAPGRAVTVTDYRRCTSNPCP